MSTQVMDPSTTQRSWNGTPYLMGGRPQGTSTCLSTSTAMPASTYMATDTMPSFSNPFMNSSKPSGELYLDTTLDAQPSPPSARTSLSSSSSPQFQYGATPVTSAGAASSSPVVTHQMYDNSFLNQGLMPTDLSFSTAPSPVNAAFGQNSFEMPAGQFMGVRGYGMDVSDSRRSSQANLGVGPLGSTQDVFGMDQETPRAPYAPSHRGGRGSSDSYNFPSAHSSTSSVSSVGSGFSQYGNFDGGSSISDYSDAEASMPPIMRTSQSQSMMPGSVPAQASMMTQFSSKVSSSVQKKHVCKICEKRFTRPSSLQTHVYSHTGEKPYQCTHPGCGRCFSVVSNLRRHQKIHRNRDRSLDPMDSRSEADSPASHVTDGDD